MGNKAMKAMVAAAGLPALGDAEAWARIGTWWREQGDEDMELRERVTELEEVVEGNDEAMDELREQARAARAYASELEHKCDMSGRELKAAREDNAALRKVIDKFTMIIPAVVVGQALRDIVARCEHEVPDTRGHLSNGRLGADAERWHPVLRAILNDARRALTAMEAGK